MTFFWHALVMHFDKEAKTLTLDEKDISIYKLALARYMSIASIYAPKSQDEWESFVSVAKDFENLDKEGELQNGKES